MNDPAHAKLSAQVRALLLKMPISDHAVIATAVQISTYGEDKSRRDNL
jgi:hypothetical protein